MSLWLNDLLKNAGYKVREVRLLRHQTQGPAGRTPYSLWRDNRADFEAYQSVQTVGNRAKLAAPFWASFVAPPAGGTLFAGIYAVERIGEVDGTWIDPLFGRPALDLTAQALDLYRTTLVEELADYIGRVSIHWGAGARSWVQRADLRNKEIVELARVFQEEAFPGYTRFIGSLSMLETLPAGWIAALRAARGIYLLTCPRTREQYVGSATGEDGFFGRWLGYALTGHGGNVGLRSRDPSDYQVSILEVSGSVATTEEIIEAEQLWKAKLRSREMGLNRN